MEEISDLKKKVEKLEYTEIKELREDINNIKLDMSRNTTLTEMSIKSSEKMSETLDSVKTTMIQMSESIKQSNQVSENLAKSVKSLENKVDIKFDEQEKRMDEIDNKSKIDIIKTQRDGIKSKISYIIGGGLGIGIGTFILKLIEMFK